MSFMILGIGFALLPLLLRPARKLRLGLPLFCGILMLTVFHGWYQAHAEPWRTASCLPGWVSRSRLG